MKKYFILVLLLVASSCNSKTTTYQSSLSAQISTSTTNSTLQSGEPLTATQVSLSSEPTTTPTTAPNLTEPKRIASATNLANSPTASLTPPAPLATPTAPLTASNPPQTIPPIYSASATIFSGITPRVFIYCPDGTQEYATGSATVTVTATSTASLDVAKNKAQFEAQDEAQKEATDNATASAYQLCPQPESALQALLNQQQALLAEMKTECLDPVNSLTQQIITIKSQYFSDLASLGGNGGVETTDVLQAQQTKLLNDTNTKIQTINNQINQIQLNCATKYGSTLPTALCNDGTFSYSQNNSGTCSDHNGVYEWFK